LGGREGDHQTSDGNPGKCSPNYVCADHLAVEPSAVLLKGALHPELMGKHLMDPELI